MTMFQKKLLGVMIGVAALIIVLRRKLQPIHSTPLLPAPPAEPTEPARITLPSHMVAEVSSTELGNIALPKTTLESDSETEEATETKEVIEASTEESETIVQSEEQSIEDDDRLTTQEREEQALPRAYCVSCREKRDVVDAYEDTLENGRLALRGTCLVCGSNVFRFLPNKPKE